MPLRVSDQDAGSYCIDLAAVHPQALQPNPFYLDVREGGLLCYPQLF
jgi:hypothetical protein